MSSDDKTEKSDRNPIKGTPGRPEKVINLEHFKSLCALQCTLKDIAGQFECSEDKIQMWCKERFGKVFSEVRDIYASNGIVSVRAQLFKRMKESDTILKHLSENLLGYTAKNRDEEFRDVTPIILKYNLEEDDAKEKSKSQDGEFQEVEPIGDTKPGTDKT
jgi:hypothetical protein